MIQPLTPPLRPLPLRPSGTSPGRLTRIRRVWHGDVLHLVFDHPDSSANLFDLQTLRELSAHLSWIEEQPDLRALCLVSAKPAIFLAGADLRSFSSATLDDLAETALFGQAVFSRLASLPVPTAALIHGACLGGGLELALACDWRLATPDRSTQLGLPETQLGILPAWGGCTRLPRLLGLPAALSLILSGKPVPAAKARSLGLVDDLVPRESLTLLAASFLARGKRPRPPRRLAHLWPFRHFIARSAARRVLEKTHGNYPAPLRALKVATSSLGRPHSASLAAEREAFLDLVQTPVAQNLIRLFLLQEEAKHLRLDASPREVRSTAVIGAGVMGAGIAHWLSSRGYPVILQDVHPDAVARGLGHIRQLYHEATSRRLFTNLDAQASYERISPAHTSCPLLRQDLVIEAATENLELKTRIFRQLVERTGPDTVLATNTSALPVTTLALSTGSAHAHRVIGVHFFNPVHQMKLVEIVRHDHASPESLATALRFVQRLGKFPVLVQDSPGFLVNRILMPYLLEAGHLVELGIHPLEIDHAMLQFGMPMGPIRLLDEIGLDVATHVAATMETAFGPRLSPPPLLATLVAAGHLGQKSGRGFYSYGLRGREVNQEFCSSHRELAREEIASRLSLLLVNESFRCLEEHIVATPQELDFAMVMGAGFAPFRGGPIRYAESKGRRWIYHALHRLAESEDPRYLPSEGILTA